MKMASEPSVFGWFGARTAIGSWLMLTGSPLCGPLSESPAPLREPGPTDVSRAHGRLTTQPHSQFVLEQLDVLKRRQVRALGWAAKVRFWQCELVLDALLLEP